jgi:uncharacterized membrane protein
MQNRSLTGPPDSTLRLETLEISSTKFGYWPADVDDEQNGLFLFVSLVMIYVKMLLATQTKLHK